MPLLANLLNNAVCQPIRLRPNNSSSSTNTSSTRPCLCWPPSIPLLNKQKCNTFVTVHVHQGNHRYSNRERKPADRNSCAPTVLPRHRSEWKLGRPWLCRYARDPLPKTFVYRLQTNKMLKRDNNTSREFQRPTANQTGALGKKRQRTKSVKAPFLRQAQVGRHRQH